jgi:hypothetical protein
VSRKNSGQPKTEKNPLGSGPKTLKIDWEIVAELCRIHCTIPEIASVLQKSEDTIQRACKREHSMRFSEYYQQFLDTGRISLRRSLWRSAIGYGGEVLKNKAGRIIYNEKTGQPVLINVQRPELGAQIFLATQPDILAMINTHKQEISGPGGGPIRTESEIDAKGKLTRAIDRLAARIGAGESDRKS